MEKEKEVLIKLLDKIAAITDAIPNDMYSRDFNQLVVAALNAGERLREIEKLSSSE